MGRLTTLFSFEELEEHAESLGVVERDSKFQINVQYTHPTYFTGRCDTNQKYCFAQFGRGFRAFSYTIIAV